MNRCRFHCLVPKLPSLRYIQTDYRKMNLEFVIEGGNMKTIILASFWLLLIPGLCSIALAQHDMRIEGVYPDVVVPGNVVDISGAYLANYTGARKVFIARAWDNHPPSFFWLDDMSVDWASASDSRVQVGIPLGLPPGDYLLKIENDSSQSLGRSNVMMVRVLDPSSWTNGLPDASMRPAWQSTVIDSLQAIGGNTYSIQGRNFRFCSNVILHSDYGQQYWPQVLSWDDNRIQVRIPAGLVPGEYFVQVNYDASVNLGSNSMSLSVLPPAPQPNFTRRMPDLVVHEFYPPRPVQGQPFEFRVTVYNRGDQSAGAFTVLWSDGLSGQPTAVFARMRSRS